MYRIPTESDGKVSRKDRGGISMSEKSMAAEAGSSRVSLEDRA